MNHGFVVRGGAAEFAGPQEGVEHKDKVRSLPAFLTPPAYHSIIAGVQGVEELGRWVYGDT